MREAPGDDQHKNMEWDEIDEEDVAAPAGDHVEVRKCRASGPEHRSGLHRLDPEVVGEQHAEDRNAFVVVGASNRAGNVARHDGDETSGDQTCAFVLKQVDTGVDAFCSRTCTSFVRR